MAALTLTSISLKYKTKIFKRNLTKSIWYNSDSYQKHVKQIYHLRILCVKLAKC